MSALLKIVLRVIKRRIEAGEELETVLLEYPKLSGEEKEILREEVERSTEPGASEEANAGIVEGEGIEG